MRSTSYAAVIWHTATFHGYCVTLYRLLRDAGINTRIVTGIGLGLDNSQEYHAWNIVELNGIYYKLDATWDAGRETYRYFLKGSESFSDHIPGKAFLDKGFVFKSINSPDDYPIAEKSHLHRCFMLTFA